MMGFGSNTQNPKPITAVKPLGPDYVLGVDGGNSKTLALVAMLDGSVVGVGRGGCSDIYTHADVNVPLSELDTAVSNALNMAGIRARELAAGGFSMAGADWPEDFALLESAMEQRGLGRKVTVVNDAVGALRGGLFEGPGVVVACGTGAATAARSEDGRVWHTSWWQDPQGSHQLGMKALHAVYRAELGIEPPTLLTEVVLGHFGLNSVEEVLYLFTARGGERPTNWKVSSLSRALLDLAHDGDLAAVRIVQEHGIHLGDYALAAARMVGIESAPFTLVLTGGVLRHPSRLLQEALVARVQEDAPLARPIYSIFEPVVGALLLAFEAAGIAVSPPLLARLTDTLPEPSLFET
jgi:N-acetylglucosamine kinase-like BadF-type ATPase